MLAGKRFILDSFIYRKYLNTNDLAGKVYVTSGLGGMSGAQGKASLIAGAIGVIAEIDPAALEKRYKQGWISEKIDNLDQCIARIKQARQGMDNFIEYD